MPVDPTHEYVDKAHKKTIDTGSPYGCQKAPPVRPFVTQYQDGWTPDGRRNMVEHRVEFKTDVICGHIGHDAINKDNDPKCRGCSRSSQTKPEAFGNE